MSRLTEKEIDLIRAVRATGELEQAGAADPIETAQRLQAKAIGELASRGATAVAHWSGFAALVSFIDDTLLRGLRASLRRRAAANQLKRLDDHLLHDIGLDRSMVEAYVESLSTDQVEPARSKPARSGGFRHWLRRRNTIRELEALDNRLLADIGLTRASIPMAVDQATTDKARVETRVTPAQKHALTQQALSATQPKQRRSIEKTISSVNQPEPVLPLWIGPWLNHWSTGSVR